MVKLNKAIRKSSPKRLMRLLKPRPLKTGLVFKVYASLLTSVFEEGESDGDSAEDRYKNGCDRLDCRIDTSHVGCGECAYCKSEYQRDDKGPHGDIHYVTLSSCHRFTSPP